MTKTLLELYKQSELTKYWILAAFQSAVRYVGAAHRGSQRAAVE